MVDIHDARTNSCWDTHAARVNSLGLYSARGNSGGHANSYRCTYSSCGGVGEGTQLMSMSTRCQDRCPAQQAPGKLHVETWAGRVGNLSLPISKAVEIMLGCADIVTRLPPPFFSSVSPRPGREVGNGIGWTSLEKTARSGVWLFRCALTGSSAFLRLLHLETRFREDRFLQHGRSSHFLRVLVHVRVSEARLSGHNLESDAGHC